MIDRRPSIDRLPSLIAIALCTAAAMVSGCSEGRAPTDVPYRLFRFANGSASIDFIPMHGRSMLAADIGDYDLLVNGPIFDTAFEPLGLVVEKGTVRKPIDTAEGAGNFYIKPNGILMISDGTARIVSTDERPDLSGVELAFQSGRLLLADGRLPESMVDADGRRFTRSAIAVDAEGFAVAVSTGEMSLKEFAEHLREEGFTDALYLDGAIVSCLSADGFSTLSGAPMGWLLGIGRR